MNTRRFWQPVVQFLSGVLLIAGMSGVVWFLLPRPVAPEDWQIIRPPVDVAALAWYDGAVWAGGRDGVVRIDPASGALLEDVRIEGNALRFVYALLVTREGDLWVGHEQGVHMLHSGRWERLPATGDTPPVRVYALLQTRDGAIWIGTETGLMRYHRDTLTVFTRQHGLASDVVSVLFEDRRGVLWAGNGMTMEGGLSSWDGTAWRTYDGLVHPMINAIIEDQNGVLWFGAGFAARGGISRFDGMTWSVITRADGLAGDKVRSLFQDADGGIWAGSEYDGVAHLTGGGWEVFDAADGFSGAETKAIMQTPDRDMWFGTDNGITRIRASFFKQRANR